MKFAVLLLTASVFLTACEGNPERGFVPEGHPTIDPVETDPGVNISGSARVGVVTTF